MLEAVGALRSVIACASENGKRERKEENKYIIQRALNSKANESDLIKCNALYLRLKTKDC